MLGGTGSTVPESRAIHLRPDNLGTTRAMLSFMSDVKGLEDLDADRPDRHPAKDFRRCRRGRPAHPRPPRRRTDVFRRARAGPGAAVEQWPRRLAGRRRILPVAGRRRRQQPGPDRGLRAGRRTVPHRRPPRRAWPDTSGSCGRTWPQRKTSGPRCSGGQTLGPAPASACCTPGPASIASPPVRAAMGSGGQGGSAPAPSRHSVLPDYPT